MGVLANDDVEALVLILPRIDFYRAFTGYVSVREFKAISAIAIFAADQADHVGFGFRAIKMRHAAHLGKRLGYFKGHLILNRVSAKPFEIRAARAAPSSVQVWNTMKPDKRIEAPDMVVV